MLYAFILGRVYTLSLAELLVVLQRLHPDKPVKILAASLEVIVVETENKLDIEKLQKQVGGIIKILKVVDIVKKRDQDSINFALQHYFKPSKIKSEFLKSTSGKIQYGVSVYLLNMGIKAFGEPKRLGMFIKRSMQDVGRGIRLVIPEFNSLALASVVVTKNLLITKGAEICILADVDKVYVAKTLSVQDFEDYGRRDYQRPVRDEKQGMIPPKVAQSMLNLAQVAPGGTILDPFCGIGTILQEGMLLSYKMLGTDINKQAIAGSEKNLEWFRNRYKVPTGRYHVDVSDARKVNETIAKLVGVKAFKEVNAIVTEGYLGPLYSKFPQDPEIKANFKELEKLYKESFQEFLKFLSKGSKVVICLPAYKKTQTEYVKFPNLDFLTDLGYNLVDLIPSNLVKSMPFLKLTERKTTIYDRKDQIVAREVVILEVK